VHGPLSAQDVATLLGPLGMFATGITGSLYAINKAADVLNNRTDAGAESAAQPPQQ